MTDHQAPANPTPGGATQDASMGGCGMALLLATLGMLFASSLFFFILMRLRAANWPPPDAPSLPGLFWLSTGLLLFSSATMHGALRAARLGRGPALRAYLLATMGLGVLFLANQALCWLPLLQAGVGRQANLYLLAFLMLAVLHALHVIGGLVPLGVITRAALRGCYSAEAHAPVRHLALYWHFLDAVWLIVFITLLVAF
jgi:cytochrome c oxidase subunit III